eukprot:CAMPEP_0204015634 /NCGR_PEP_ID=MMETSP0360-20130528/26204_1 /ASSEMBLY_ACC=CAM_ASM_000342 /TAXON_ID=268821 /ORGANISM="Scrippsiella Hangoei, Strain SHTV-5" /LENGTH=46 /DNA_ID= /DNA_START= /DNA_END= /DNA_ORIENTATION=
MVGQPLRRRRQFSGQDPLCDPQACQTSRVGHTCATLPHAAVVDLKV